MNRPAVLAIGAGVVLAAAVASVYAKSAPSSEISAAAADPWADPWGDGLAAFLDGTRSLLTVGEVAPGADPEIAGAYTTENGEGDGYVALIDDYLIPAAYGVLAPFSRTRRIMSPSGLALLQRHERFRAAPYRDPVGIWTVGYGHRILPGETFGTLSMDEAVQLLARDVGIAEDAVNALVKVPLNQAQFDALVSWVYNVGTGAFRRSTLLRVLNAGDYAAVPAQLARWKYGTRAGVRVELPGLVARRADEAQLFASAPAPEVYV